MGKRKSALRYKQLDEAQRSLLRGPSGSIGVAPGLKSFTGKPENFKHYEIALEGFQGVVADWRSRDAWVHAFIKRCDDQSLKSKRAYEAIAGEFKNGFARFLKQSGGTALGIDEYSTELVQEFYKWLETDKTKKAGYADGDGTARSPNTARKYFQQFRLLFEQLVEDPKFGQILPKLVFPNIAFSGANDSNRPVEVLDDETYALLYRGCRSLAEVTIGRIHFAASIFGAHAPAPHVDSHDHIPSISPAAAARYSKHKYFDRAKILHALNAKYPGVLPDLKSIKRDDKELGEAVQRVHTYRVIQEYFQPSAETILPFIILIAIYSQANTGPLRFLRTYNVREVEVMGSRRVLYEFEKGRGQYSYQRSFALDENDPLSPGAIRDTVRQWTERIRRKAEPEAADNLFIFVSQLGRVRSFLTATDYGTDSDSSWKNSISNLCDRLGIAELSTSQLRFTGLDIIRELTNDDLRAVKAAGGQRAESTIKLHYEGAGAERRRHEGLAEVMQTAVRWVKTAGRSEVRSTTDTESVAAATPGWGCIDPYSSPIVGESAGRLCGAFGCCPACPLALLNCEPPYALARALQLRAEYDSAMEYLEYARWKSRYESAAIALRDRWLTGFTNPQTWEQAAKLNLGPIGVLE